MPKPKFSIGSMLVLFSAFAIVVGAVAAIDRGYQPDPSSESFQVLAVSYTPTWSNCQPTINKTGLRTSPLAIEKDYSGSNLISHRQELFRYSYKDRFGKTTFDVNYEIDASFTADWDEYLFYPVVSGGGNTGASASIATRLDAENQTLSITIRQGFSASRLAKQCTLRFAWDGQKFKLLSQRQE